MRSSRRCATGVRVAVSAALTVALAAGCTSEPDAGPEPAPASSPAPDASTGAAATLEARPVPLDLKIGQVPSTRISKKQRRLVERQVGRTVASYFDDAYLGGEYPRRGFADAFGTFFDGAARKAVSRRATLTNAALGPRTEAVVPRRKWARLAVLVPGDVVAGVTAKVRLVYDAVLPDAADQRVTVTGRLLLSRARNGSWKIFGFDLARSAVPVRKGADR